jgi:hypothetical protein
MAQSLISNLCESVGTADNAFASSLYKENGLSECNTEKSCILVWEGSSLFYQKLDTCGNITIIFYYVACADYITTVRCCAYLEVCAFAVNPIDFTVYIFIITSFRSCKHMGEKHKGLHLAVKFKIIMVADETNVRKYEISRHYNSVNNIEK